MKGIYTLLTTLALLTPSLGHSLELHIQLPIERISLSDEGMFFLPEGEDPIGLYNLQMNTQGYYTSFHLSYVNGDDIHRTACELLLAIVPQLEIQWLEDDLPLTVELNAILNEPAITHLLAMSGKISGEVTHDSSGNTSAKGGATITSNDKSSSFKVDGKVTREPSGKIKGEVTGRYEKIFRTKS